MVTADRYHRAFVAKNDFRDPRRNNADAKLTRIVAFDDRDIGVTNALFDLLAHAIERFAALLGQRIDRHAADTGARPKKYLRNSMLADHLSLHLIGIDVEMLRQMNTEAQAVEEGPGAQHPIVPRAGAGDIGEGIGRIGYDQYDRAGRGARNFRNDVTINFSVLD